uniref:EGF-like domain-containing protein n=1 Tax=Leptobrachium leishanense TaxID=445787 RepID=A0A8C5RBH8_9ANUR
GLRLYQSLVVILFSFFNPVSYVRTCSSSQFRCDDARCIPRTWVCDGDNDCGDMSDEDQRHNCDRWAGCFITLAEFSSLIFCILTNIFLLANRSCAPTEFTCINNRPPDRRCIPQSWVCDGDSDCSDAYDEHQNCTRASCQFTCQNGRCIPKVYVCDGDNDCEDESDELDHMCTTPEATCPPNYFKCDNGHCIEAVKVCNRIDECSDNSDEKGCGMWNVSEISHYCIQFNSMIKATIQVYSFISCPVFSSLISVFLFYYFLGINECNDPSVSGCDHNCTDTQTSFYCSCRPGFRLMSDKRTCDDIDECAESPSVCSQICENTVGSYLCKCAPGYIREPDGKRCRQNSNIEPSLIFSNRYYIRNLTVNGLSYSMILQGLSNVVSLDFDRVDSRLYWIDVGRRVIERMFLNGTNKETIISHDVLSGEGLAVDWVGRKIYWVDAYKDCLNVAELDGRFRKKLLEHCVDVNNTYCFQYPRAIVLHPKKGYVYWTDWGDNPYIGRVGMDGKNKTAIITTKLEWPNGVTIDYTNDKLYWADAHLNYIEFSDLEGRHRHAVYSGNLPHPYAITVFEDFVYWTDWNTRTVEKGNKYDGSGRTMLANTTHRPFDIHVYHPYRQPIRK